MIPQSSTLYRMMEHCQGLSGPDDRRIDLADGRRCITSLYARDCLGFAQPKTGWIYCVDLVTGKRFKIPLRLRIWIHWHLSRCRHRSEAKVTKTYLTKMLSHMADIELDKEIPF